MLTVLSIITMIHTCVLTKSWNWITCRGTDTNNCIVCLAYLGKGRLFWLRTCLSRVPKHRICLMRTAKKCKDKSHSYSMQLSRGTKSRIRYLENDLDSQSPVKCKHSQSSTPKIPHQSEAEKNARKKLRNMFIDVVSSTDNMQSSCISDMTTFDTEHGSYQLKTFKTVGIITQIVPITNKQTVPMTNKQTVLMTKKQTVQTNKKQTVLITKKQTVPMTKK